MREMKTARNQVIDQMVDEILAKQELLDYFVSTVMESIPQNSRKDKRLCESIVSFTMDEALKDARVLQLIENVVNHPSDRKKKFSKKSKRRSQPRSPTHALLESTDDLFTPSFSTTEPIRLEPESSKRKQKKLKTSQLIERRNKELRQQHSDSDPVNPEMSDLNLTGTLTFTGKEILFKGRDQRTNFNKTRSHSEDNGEEQEEEEEGGYERVMSDLNSSCSTVNNNIPTENNVDIYSSDDDLLYPSNQRSNGHSGAGNGNAANSEDDVEAYMSAWENRVQNSLIEDNLETDSAEWQEPHHHQQQRSGTTAASGCSTALAATGGSYSSSGLSVECEEYIHEEDNHSDHITGSSGRGKSKGSSGSSSSSSSSSSGGGGGGPSKSRHHSHPSPHNKKDESDLPYSLSSTLFSGTNTSTSNMLFFDQSTFDDEVDHLQSGKKAPFQKRAVHFPKQLVTGIQYRDKVTPEEKNDMFYNHAEEFRFTRDQSREFAKADAMGMTWNDWIAQRTDEDALKDEEEAAAAGDGEYFDDFEDGDGGVLMYFSDYMDGGAADEYAYDTEFTDLLDAKSYSESESDNEEDGDDDEEEEELHIVGSNDDSDWQGAVVFDRRSSGSKASQKSKPSTTATAAEGEASGVDVVFQTDEQLIPVRDPEEGRSAADRWHHSSGSGDNEDEGEDEGAAADFDDAATEEDWEAMPAASDSEDEEAEGEEEKGDVSVDGEGNQGEGDSMDTLEDGQPYQRTTVSKIQKMASAQSIREFTAGGGDRTHSRDYYEEGDQVLLRDSGEHQPQQKSGGGDGNNSDYSEEGNDGLLSNDEVEEGSVSVGEEQDEEEHENSFF